MLDSTRVGSSFKLTYVPSGNLCSRPNKPIHCQFKFIFGVAAGEPQDGEPDEIIEMKPIPFCNLNVEVKHTIFDIFNVIETSKLINLS